MLKLLLGIVFFLIGFEVLKEGVNSLSTQHVKKIIYKLSDNKIKTFIMGIFLTFLFQSSSTMTSLLVSMTDSGIISLKSACVMALGSGIGSAITVKIISFDISTGVYSLIIIGGILYLSKSGNINLYGRTILGIGLVFYGIMVMESAFHIDSNSKLLPLLISFIQGNYFYFFIAGLLLTVILQTSASSLGILMGVSSSGMLSPAECFAFVLGANVGTTSTAFIASFTSGADGKRAAIGYFLSKLIGAVVFLLFIEEISKFLFSISMKNMKFFIADSNMIFNIINSILFLPFTGFFTKLLMKLVPEKTKTKGKAYLKYIDKKAVENVSVAVAQSHRELLRMYDEVGEMLEKCILAFETNETNLISEIKEMDNSIDFLDENIRKFLVEISKSPLDRTTASKTSSMIRISSNLENIGDTIEKDLMDHALKKVKKNAVFSEDGRREIEELHKEVMEYFRLLGSALSEFNKKIAEEIVKKKSELYQLTYELVNRHLERLKLGLKESVDTSSIHLDVISNLRRIISFIADSGSSILQIE